MKKRLTLNLLFLICFLSFKVVAFASDKSDSKEVVVRGAGAIYQGDVALARDTAISDALRKAVEEVMGTLVQADTLVKNFELIEDNIYTQTKGYIKNYEVLKEEELQGVYRVTVKAVVGLKKLQDDLIAINILQQRMHKPRVMVMMLQEEALLSSKKGISLYDRTSEGEIIKNLLEQGFETIDSNQIRKKYDEVEIKEATLGNDALVSQMGSKLGAEVVIVGKASWEKMEGVDLGGLVSCKARVEARAVKCDVGSILAAEGIGAAGVDIIADSASKKAITEASKKVVQSLINQILEAWTKETSGGRLITLEIFNVSFKDLQEFENVLKNQIRGISAIYRRSFEKDVAVIDVESKQSAQELSVEISSKDFGFPVSITGFSANKLDIRVR